MKPSLATFMIPFLTLLSVGAMAAPSEFPIQRLAGSFSYQGHFAVPSARRAETVDMDKPEGEARIKELRTEGYSCIRKNQTLRLCSKIWTPEKPPQGTAEAVAEFMKPIRVEFEGSQTPPELIHDGSTTQEWQVNEKVKVLTAELSAYRVVKTNKEKIFIVFPVSESQPLSPLEYHSAEKLSLMIIANTKDTATSTLAYTIVADLDQQ